jgi:hypothetical protein
MQPTPKSAIIYQPSVVGRIDPNQSARPGGPQRASTGNVSLLLQELLAIDFTARITLFETFEAGRIPPGLQRPIAGAKHIARKHHHRRADQRQKQNREPA